MSMFCYQCQETAKNTGCTVRGVCGKDETTAILQDVLIYTLKGLSLLAMRKKNRGESISEEGIFLMKCLFATITNANFDENRIADLIREANARKKQLAERYAAGATLSRIEVWHGESKEDLLALAGEASLQSETDTDVRSLRELVTYGLKGLAAYGVHAHVLGFENEELFGELIEIIAAATRKKTVNELFDLVLRTGKACVEAMALLDKANTSNYGHPEMTRVNTAVGNNPGILVSGHDLKDLEELLEQTRGTGIDVYTHGEMLPAHYYPAFKKYPHLAGNYGGSWWRQDREFTSFNGPILMTTNCITPVKESYRSRIFTTGMAGYPGIPHIMDGKPKDFSSIIKLAKKCASPQPPHPHGPIERSENGTAEQNEIIGGFAHKQIEQLSGKIVQAVKSGRIKKFVVMGGCDGRMKSREYFTEVAQALPEDTVILTAGCAKFRYNTLLLGSIDGIPRVLDAGQCNDSYSIAVTALKLREAFGLSDINELPVDFDIAWYEQKALCVLLALLALGFKGIRIGPTLPAFLSDNVKKVLTENFDLKVTADVESDVRAIVEG